MKIGITLFVATLFTLNSQAQSSDSVVVSTLREAGIRFSHNNSVTLLTNGQEKFTDLFRAVQQARQSVHLEYFNFRNDSIANALFDLLAQKAEKGITVRAVFDAFGNSSNNQPLRKRHINSLRSRGIHIYEFDPIRFPWINHVFARDHRKIVVIDGRVAYTGGMNVADYYIKGTKEIGSWNDLHCRIEGGAVNDLQAIFVKTWKKVSGETVEGSQYYGGGMSTKRFIGLKPDTTNTQGEKMVGIINREPRTSNAIIRTFYLTAINAATDSIKIINPYFTLNRKIKRALYKALERGVKIDIMLSTRSDIPLTPDCGFYNAHKLMKKGCNVWMYTPGFHHTKIISVDGKLCTVGSANLNARSLSWDYEANAVIVDKATTRELDNLFIKEKKDSWKLTEASWRKWRTKWQRFRGWFAHLLAPFL